MKIIKSSVDIQEQQPGIIGMKKHIELIGRISHKSEDKISEDSYIKFIDMIKKTGHWAVFDMGTVYLKIPVFRVDLFFKFLKSRPFTKINFKSGFYYITTTYRIIVRENLENLLEKYWCEPCKYHYYRATTHWICSLGISHELVRHASLRPLQESTRYCNYNGDKFDNELTFILPQWIYKLRDNLSNTIDSLTGEDRKWLKEKDGFDLWRSLCCLDRTVASRNNFWKSVEEEYIYETSTDEGEKLKPEDARGVLPKDLKTELYLCGYLEDWYKHPVNSKERTGFFYLRSDKSAHPDVRVLSQELEKLFIKEGYDRRL